MEIRAVGRDQNRPEVEKALGGGQGGLRGDASSQRCLTGEQLLEPSN